MKALILVILTTISIAIFSQGEISTKAWNNYVHKHDSASLKIKKVVLPSSGSGLIIYGTPSVITSFLTIPYSGGTFQSPDGSIQPGLQYTIELAHYNVTPTGIPLTNYFGVGGFLVAGGIGSSTSPRLKGSVILGVDVNLSSYVTVGYGYDPINKSGSLVVGGKFDLSVIEQGITASIFWVKQQ